MILDISKVQDECVGDGTTTVAVLAGELLREAEKLVNKRIHPQNIITGFRLASDAARKRLNELHWDSSADNEKFR
jgi:T-complex protein 1 subunit beta